MRVLQGEGRGGKGERRVTMGGVRGEGGGSRGRLGRLKEVREGRGGGRTEKGDTVGGGGKRKRDEWSRQQNSEGGVTKTVFRGLDGGRSLGSGDA